MILHGFLSIALNSFGYIQELCEPACSEGLLQGIENTKVLSKLPKFNS
jgi:hypothetical protein